MKINGIMAVLAAAGVAVCAQGADITEMPANHVLPPHSIILVNF
jgi:hypothetical protein